MNRILHNILPKETAAAGGASRSGCQVALSPKREGSRIVKNNLFNDKKRYYTVPCL